jgi:hypothetical protein
MPKKLSPEHEIIAAHIAATTAAFQVLILALQENGALQPGQVAAGLLNYMEIAKHREGNEIELSLLHDLRLALVN